MRLHRSRTVMAAVVLAVAAAAGGAVAGVAAAAPANTRAAGSGAGVPAPYTYIHDPAMAEQDGTYYVFSTGDPAGVIGNGNIQIRTSRNLKSFGYTGTVFSQIPAWITSELGPIPNLWAPDISYFGGLWHLY